MRKLFDKIELNMRTKLEPLRFLRWTAQIFQELKALQVHAVIKIAARFTDVLYLLRYKYM